MNTKLLVDRFLSWPLPESLCSDPCASMPGYPHRTGTNLMTAEQAEAMIEYVVAAPRQPEGEWLEVVAYECLSGFHVSLSYEPVGDNPVPLWRAPDAQRAIAELREECERLRMQLAACGVVALANTPESAAQARQMHPDYMSASCSDVADAVDREITLRQQLAERDATIARLEAGIPRIQEQSHQMRQQRDKLAKILLDLVPGCKWRIMRPRIDAALAEIDHDNE